MMGQGWGRPAKARSRVQGQGCVESSPSRVELMSQRDVPLAGPLTCAFFSGSGKGKVTGEERAICMDAPCRATTRFREMPFLEGGAMGKGARSTQSAVRSPQT
ncbi:hypothetical protein CORC01_08813 [Colletotrichum orchidophilum]|uniref:Uncharacterized protein n=1 Tax=Colletotrichum orchidophilum TaxID=1209926 RepID=A0A1G4B3H9_9PEZI|nr:uncharacterized protein CORC01_08813 [Colletotrichum orchidophilum]OHE95961.1 hypothetical protein CORC01_08813 [Colletotrichum orchidophilum]